jgi:hypothetical protein
LQIEMAGFITCPTAALSRNTTQNPLDFMQVWPHHRIFRETRLILQIIEKIFQNSVSTSKYKCTLRFHYRKRPHTP